MNYYGFVRLMSILEDYNSGRVRGETKVKISDLRKAAAECDEDYFKVKGTSDEEFMQNLTAVISRTVAGS